MQWQASGRLWQGPLVFPFVEGTRLVGRRAVINASGAYCVGLVEPDWGGFLLHMLQPDDVLYDIGANIGTYTVIGSICGARVVAVEPAPETYSMLLDNIHLNRIETLVKAVRVGLAASESTMAFSYGLDSINHVLSESECGGIEIPVTTLDSLVTRSGWRPTGIKVDVEGFETAVLDGAGDTLTDPSLRFVLIELRGHGKRYGFDEWAVHQRICGAGFLPVKYDPMNRVLRPYTPNLSLAHPGDMMYVRDVPLMSARAATAPKRRILNATI